MAKIEIVELPISGHDNQPVHHSFLRHVEGSDHLSIMFPGGTYGPESPVLYYPSLLLTDRGSDLLRMEELYAGNPDFIALSEQERARMIMTDAMAAVEGALAERDYRRITLIGKSMGTYTMARLLKVEKRLAEAECIWLTPVFDSRWCETVIEYAPRSLFVAGTADNFFNPDLFQEVVEGTHGDSLLIDGANHGLVVPGDLQKTLEGISMMIDAIDFFLDA